MSWLKEPKSWIALDSHTARFRISVVRPQFLPILTLPSAVLALHVAFTFHPGNAKTAATISASLP